MTVSQQRSKIEWSQRLTCFHSNYPYCTTLADGLNVVSFSIFHGRIKPLKRNIYNSQLYSLSRLRNTLKKHLPKASFSTCNLHVPFQRSGNTRICQRQCSKNVHSPQACINYIQQIVLAPTAFLVLCSFPKSLYYSCSAFEGCHGISPPFCLHNLMATPCMSNGISYKNYLSMQ